MLLFLSRVAFICNLFFLCSVALQFRSFVNEDSLVSTIVILGYFFAVFLFNPIANVSYVISILLKRKLFKLVPKWLVLTNFIMLIVQILYIILFLNDTVYN
jgi:hypothetical protein